MNDQLSYKYGELYCLINEMESYPFHPTKLQNNIPYTDKHFDQLKKNPKLFKEVLNKHEVNFKMNLLKNLNKKIYNEYKRMIDEKIEEIEELEKSYVKDFMLEDNYYFGECSMWRELYSKKMIRTN